MTEKQGGSDVRANITRAEPCGDGEYLLEGHKWFCSAPMCDAFLMLAQAPRGLSCFLLPRWTAGWNERNAFHLQRLKPKLGNRSNASSEVEFHGAWARTGRRGGTRRRHHHRDGAAHAPGLRDCVGRADAARAGARPCIMRVIAARSDGR